MKRWACSTGPFVATLMMIMMDPFLVIGDFVGDDDFKEEIFYARVVQLLMNVSQDKEEYPAYFYHSVNSVLYCICSNSTDLATTFVANGGVEFLLERLETFSSDQFLLLVIAGHMCFAVYKNVIENLDENQSVAFAGMALAKLEWMSFEINFETRDDFLPELLFDVLQCIVSSHVWHR